MQNNLRDMHQQYFLFGKVTVVRYIVKVKKQNKFRNNQPWRAKGLIQKGTLNRRKTRKGGYGRDKYYLLEARLARF